ncbi:50S ribosomal protein L11 [Candidatus Aminicenantes bacterium AC-335-B20]|jgi:large subunit ribosomal protein L11|nr:50S ribosomal protein L11 [SCandidatus Aminicenantes bacterium Aminicenantia_JdfR_composite]MCP2597172.1 50S ribosomal protein L11 [Candidatus Aminicenantes bacterium AC-335-G13]MCP2598557.1 50S ribosomal protein L11 [Candidatus Aminicenantes bacterium AC-335-L06]MCP2599029.1 50S ribosomal protein L11 [Candidatus Aminicenantes bacterium AC-335-B20]MCP2619296.1 50S ribosomal protein L11 [Candidatus Aminicenantes bacterium AC-335-K20]MCP2620855.1 50S ribosomal protein L11 [Candidatus Aminicen
MPKEVIAQVKLQLEAGKASPAPPVGPALGQHNVNIMEFVKAFNDKTKNMEEGTIVPVLITIYSDRKFDFVIKTPPASFLLKKAAKIIKGSSEPNKTKVGRVTMKQIEEIAKIKMKDLNTNDLEKAKKIIIGTAKSMGLEIANE